MQEIKDTYYSGAERKSADLTFYAAGSQQTKSDYQYGPIVRNYHVIHFVSRGCGTLTIRNKTYTVRSGQAFIIPAQIPASYKADFADPWDYSWISFLGLRSNGYVRQLLHACGNSFVTPTLPVRSYRDLIDKFLVDNSTHNGLSQSFRATALLYEVLSCLFRDLSIDSEPLSHHPMEEVKYFIEMNVGKDLKVHEIASRF